MKARREKKARNSSRVYLSEGFRHSDEEEMDDKKLDMRNWK